MGGVAVSVKHMVRFYWPADSEGNECREARYKTYCGKMIFAEIEDYEMNNKAWKYCDCEECLESIVVHIIRVGKKMRLRRSRGFLRGAPQLIMPALSGLGLLRSLFRK